MPSRYVTRVPAFVLTLMHASRMQTDKSDVRICYASPSLPSDIMHIALLTVSLSIRPPLLIMLVS